MRARLTGAGHMLHISQGFAPLGRQAGDWHWWVLDHDGRRMGESVLIGDCPPNERPQEADIRRAHDGAVRRIGSRRWDVFAFDELKWAD